MVKKEKELISQSKYLSDSDSSNDNEINPRLKTSVEERQYNTIPGSAIATHIALSYSRLQANPTIEDHHIRKPRQTKLMQRKQRLTPAVLHTKINNDQLLCHFVLT